MQILILVLSYNQSPYSDLMKAQEDTWAGGCKTIFYYGGVDGPMPEIWGIKTETCSWIELAFPITDSYFLMAAKFKLSLEYLQKLDIQYDFIFRTNSSSYVNCSQLLKFAETLPKEKCYAGWTMEDSNFDGGLMVSGAGIWLSPDCAEILRKEIDPTEEREEDVLIGRVLRKNGITAIDDRSRIDYQHTPTTMEALRETYHIRFKGPSGDRLHDADNMRFIHQQIINQ